MKILLKSKLHNFAVTGTNLSYEGSCAIDPDLLRDAHIREYEQLHICNITNGERFITYAIKGEPGQICLNGACARLAVPGDRVIITTYELYDSNRYHQPNIIVYGQ